MILRHWVRQARPFPYARRTSAAAMALLWFVGGITSLATAVVPHPPSMSVAILLLVACVAPMLALFMWRFRDTLPTWVDPVVLAIGTGTVGVLVLAAGGGAASVSFTFFYLWVVMYALLFFAPIVAASEIVGVIISYGVAAFLNSSPGAHFTAVEPVVLFSVIGTMGAVVLSLARTRELSEVDPLTRLTNRRGLDRVLGEAMRNALAGTSPLIVAIIDVDDFKGINDRDGHQAGDLILRQLAQRWAKELRAGDTVSRFGGDEFVVVLPHCEEEVAKTILDRLLDGTDIDVTCSVGSARWCPGDSASLLIARADSALYTAKRYGRNQVVWAHDLRLRTAATSNPAAGQTRTSRLEPGAK